MQGGFDALTHLDAEPLRDRVPEVVDEARRAGVSGMLVAGWDPDGWSTVRAVGRGAGAVVALGVHPWVVGRVEDPVALLDGADPAVVGEIGLDHHVTEGDDDRATQRRAFRDQLAWARDHDRPVVLHAVRALPEVLHVVRQDGLPDAGGMVHGWYADAERARQAIDLGLHLSFGPLLLGRHPHKLHASLRAVPRDRVLLETDAPEQALPGRPQPTPADLVRIAEAVAAIWREDVAGVLYGTGHTARRLFRCADPSVQRS